MEAWFWPHHLRSEANCSACLVISPGLHWPDSGKTAIKFTYQFPLSQCFPDTRPDQHNSNKHEFAYWLFHSWILYFLFAVSSPILSPHTDRCIGGFSLACLHNNSHCEPGKLFWFNGGVQWISAKMCAGPWGAASLIPYGESQDVFYHLIVNRKKNAEMSENNIATDKSCQSLDSFVAYFREVFGKPLGDLSISEVVSVSGLNVH